MEKLYTSKTLLKMASGRMYAPGPHLTPPGHEVQKSSKESGIFQILHTISFFFTKRQSQKVGGRGTMPPLKYAPA